MSIHRQHRRVIYPDWMQPVTAPTGTPRISGTAMPGGVFMSTGTTRSAGDLWLILTGLSIAVLGSGAMVLTYVVSWAIEQLYSVPLTPVMMMMQTPAVEDAGQAYLEMGVNVLMLLSFLVLMRLSPLSGYHAAEHKVIAAIEHFGEATMEKARMMPRAHRRCGSNLLAGVLPLLLLGGPLFRINVVLATVIIVLGWSTRFYTGYAIQAVFATKEPTDRQLRAGIEAGRTILQRWQKTEGKPVPPLVNFWRRGLVQMFGGMIIGTTLISQLYQHLHVWLDF